MGIRSIYDQVYPPPATLTEHNVPSQKGKVFIVTGGNSGIGFELCKLLYGAGATIYMASRSKERAEKALQIIIDTKDSANSPGLIKFLPLDLGDLTSVKAAAAAFSHQESKLDVLWNNAGTGPFAIVPGAKTAQDFGAMIGMHCLATLLFTELLHPQLCAAVAGSSTKGSVRVVWTSSISAESSPPNGIVLEELKDGTKDPLRDYGASKAGSWMLAREMARRYKKDGIVAVAQNPGNIKANSYNGAPSSLMFFMNMVLKDTKLGAYTEMWAGLSPEITQENSGAYVIPWGRIRADKDCPRKDIINAMVPESEGGLGYDTKLWDWCEEQWRPFT